MTDVIKEKVEQVAEVLTKSMGAGKWIKDFIKSKNPRFAGKSEEKRKEMALGAFYSKEETESVDEGMFSPPKMITGKAAKNRKDYLRDYHPRLIAAKKAAGSSKDYDYEPQRDSETGGTKPSTHKNVYNSNKFKPATKMSFEAGLKRAAERAKSKTNEEVSLDEGRGRPPKEGSAAWKKRQSEGGGDSDTPGLHGQLIKHKHLQNAPPKIKFNNGEEAHVSAEHRDRAIKHLEGMIGPGKNPQARDNAVKAMSHSHAGFKQAIGVESKPEEKKSSMSAQRDKPKLSLTKEESEMSQEDIVEKLQAALDAGILSQNDFDKLTQIAESPAAWQYSGSVGPKSNTNTHKSYTMTIPGHKELADYPDEKVYHILRDENPHLTHGQVKAIVHSAGDPTAKMTVKGDNGKPETHHVVNHQEPGRLYDEVNYTGNPIDEKTLSPKQKKIAAVAGDPDKIDAEDFKKLRKEETTAGVAAVAAALSRNLKELK